MRLFKWTKRKSTGEIILYSVVSLLFLVIACSYIYILLWAVIAGSKTHSEIALTPFSLPKEWHFEHFVEVFRLLEVNESNFFDMLFNSVWFSVLGVGLQQYVSISFAYACSKYKFPGSGIFYTVVLFVITLPIYGNSGAMYELYHRLGLSYVDGTGAVTFENKGDTSTNPKLKEMAQALLVRVSGKSVDIERCDFLGDEVQKIKENWVLEDATNKEAFVYTDAWFASHTTAPVFESGAASEATVTWSEDGAILSFPAATHEGEFVYYYEITVDGTTKNYLTDYWSGIQSMATTCEYLLEGVASYSTISIRAVDEYGNKSEVITISK